MTAANLPVIWRSAEASEDYEAARVGRVFNMRRPNRYPTAVVQVTEESHIVEAVKLARGEKCRVSVRAGGHSWAAWSVRDDAVLIEMGRYKFIELDRDSGIVTVSPSTTGRALNAYLGQMGLMYPGGHCPDVGLGGFLLQGGMGWLCRTWGWSCQTVKAIDVVTADGKLLRCDEKQNTELWWAARGAGPTFPAVVTKFHLQTRPLPTCMRSSGYFYPKEDFERVFNWVKDLTRDYDRDTEIVCVGQYLPDFPNSLVFILLVTFKWSEEDATSALRPAEDSHPSGAVLTWFARPTSLPMEYEAQAGANPTGHRYCCDNAYIENDADVASVLKEAFTTLPSRKAFSLWYAMAPVSRQPLQDMALSLHSDHYFALYTIWDDEKDDERCQSWVYDVMKKVESHSIGAYLGDSDFDVRRSKYWSDDNAQRLADVRKKWDPERRFVSAIE